MDDVTNVVKAVANYDKVITSAYNAVRVGKIYKKVFDVPKYEYMFPFLDKRLFATLNVVDLFIGLKYLDISQAMHNQLEANYFARIVALNAHEALNDLPKLSNIKIRQAIIEQIGQDGIVELDRLIKALNDLKKRI